MLFYYVLLWASVLIAHWMSPSFRDAIIVNSRLNPSIARDVWLLPLFLALGLQAAGFRSRTLESSYYGSEARILVGLALGGIFYLAVSAVFAFALVGRYVLLFTVIYGNAFILGARLLQRRFVAKNSRRMLVYSSVRAYDYLCKCLERDQLGYVVGGFATLDHERGSAATQVPEDNILQFCTENLIDDVVVELDASLSPSRRAALLSCTAAGINVVSMNAFFEYNYERVYEEGINESWFWDYNKEHLDMYYIIFKRATDIAVGAVGLVIFAVMAPFLMAVAWIGDRGPFLYSQTRVGRFNRPFRMYKVRTMRVDAEAGGAQWAKEKDPRVTLLGNLLRKTRIDEMPQFWNVLKGEMSIVGPRPERPEMTVQIEQSIEFYRFRHLIKPGITGWAQINFPYGASIEDARRKLSYDFFYLKYASAALDLLIMMRTVSALVRGAR
ncbi:MAG TPA: exopolysaccharide biosynthesis polyprenyl glycosylphosphotransferase [Lacunisphaera sp.]|nr:exopolysaccharide biosynthesis polyprenyl glycosylphosphotransferase [Lacunisphaera sp.]